MILRILLPAALGLALLFGAACSGDDPEPTPTPSKAQVIRATLEAMTPVPTREIRRIYGPPAPPIPPTPTTVPGPPLQGLVTRPQVTAPHRVLTVPAPAPGVDLRGPDPKRDEVTTVLYDLANARRIELGKGSTGFFSPDRSRMTWESNETPGTRTIAVIDIRTEEQRHLGPGYAPSFFNNAAIRAHSTSRSSREILLDVTTGIQLPQGQAGSPIISPSTLVEPQLARARVDDVTGQGPGKSTTTLQVTDLARPAQALFRFEAFRSFVVDDDTILVAADPIVLEAPDRNPLNPRASRLLTSLYLVSVSRRTVTYISTIELYAQCWHLVANREYVVWQNGGPYPNQPDLMVYSRRTGSVTQVHSEFLPTLVYGGFYSNGLLYGRGTAFTVIDLEAMSYFAILPQPAAWTADFRYASTGAIGGRDGPCFGQEPWP
jgi:hypothetical protein